MGKLFQSIFFICFLAWLLVAATYQQSPTVVSESIAQFRQDSKKLAESIVVLGSALDKIKNNDPKSISNARVALTNSRLAYKRMEYFLEYFLPTSSRIYNRAPKNEVEEPFIEYQAPAGFQYIEQMLFDSFPESHKSELSDLIQLLSLSAENLDALLFRFPGTESQVLESIRLELIRIISLGITGFDAPSLKTGIRESKIALESVRDILAVYSKNEKIKTDSLDLYLNSSIAYLTQNPDFDSFNRMHFLTDHALPLQLHLGLLIKDLNLTANQHNILNYKAKHIFSKDAFLTESFTKDKKKISKGVVDLGKRLFSDNRLSGNNRKSCASCHDPKLYFSDGLARSKGFISNTFVNRNAPTLLYAGLQHSQFWDGRAKSLEMQIENVIKDPAEMRGNPAAMLSKLNSDKNYRASFQKAFGKKQPGRILEKEIYMALASYVRSLMPFNSKFDHYINGDKGALTENQIAGFNLFMGKAQCGTCHFAPVFNGLIPPAYILTEFEVLGTPASDDLKHPIADEDLGRSAIRPIPFLKSAFKTPTVRNTAVTGPYMHNGAFKSFDTVIEFYDLGGGAGIKLDIPNQTLSSARLNLTDDEKRDIISFLEALTDDI